MTNDDRRREDEELEEGPNRDDRPLPARISIEIGQSVDETLRTLSDELSYWARRGFDSKVRIKFRGKTVLNELPVAAFMVAELALLVWGGLLRALLLNVGGGAILDVEFISNAAPFVARGKEHLLDGDADEALDCFLRAVAADRGSVVANYHVGVCYRLKGDAAQALTAFQTVLELEPDGEFAEQAREQLRKLRMPARAAR